MRRLDWVLWVSLTLLAGHVGCVGTPSSLGDQCERNSDCQTPFVCRLARCRKECASQRDCPVGSLCFRDQQGLGVCRLPDEATCTLDSQCPSTLSCIASECTEACTEDRDCTPGALCLGEAGMRRCVNPSGMGCVDSTQCPDDMGCGFDGRCRPRCARNRDCDPGFGCASGMCVPVGLDAGMDASVADSGAPEGGLPDGSTDAGPLDASSMDAATTDGGTMDAGTTDAGAMDAGGCTSPADCTAPNVTTSDCVGGACVIVACAGTFEDCDSDFVTGCESDIDVDPLHCGVCGGDCGRSGICTSGVCDTVVDIGAGGEHTCFTRSSGTVLCVGENDYGELGRGIVGGGFVPTLAEVMSPGAAISTKAGVFESCILRSDGTVACMGANGVGQIGNGTTTMTVTVPSMVSSLTDAQLVSVGGQASGPNDGFACVLRTGGAVSCWGDERTRGDGMTGDTNVPVAVAGLSDAVDLSAGYRYACAVRTGGSVVCWGERGSKLGAAGVTMALTTPTAVTGISDATHVAAGQGHTCARRTTGEVDCWGDNMAGRIGADPATITDSPMPLTVSGITDAVDVDVSALTSCALRTGGVVSCWGFGGADGALGNGSTGTTHTPVDATGLSASLLEVGQDAVCAIRTNGAVACWGARALDLAGGTAADRWTTPTDHPAFPPTPIP